MKYFLVFTPDRGKSSKEKKAIELGVQVITVEQLEEMLK
jgi:NAD-dependent DNA ligase